MRPTTRNPLSRKKPLPSHFRDAIYFKTNPDLNWNSTFGVHVGAASCREKFHF